MVDGDTALLGKKTGADAEQNKMTWVALRGVEGTIKDAAEQAELAAGAADRMPWEHAFFTELARGTVSRRK